ncbi:hypothetical protein HU719_002135 [Pseudomonas sp. SWRI107]|uniref:RHS repeat domain-containing protein n=1 Tax=Pseudomonas farsensis TaxID=2745492 RepID=UPI001C3DD7A4|nr:hypothetical protein [Pseudomonas farsensis]
MPALSTLIGSQTFDGLGRQRSVQVAGRTTQYHYRAGQVPPTANTLADGKRIDFVYEGVLGNALLSTEAQDQTPERLEYHPLLGRPVAASNALGSQKWQFTAAGKPLADSWTVDGQTHTTTWQESLGGTLLGFTDTSGTPHKRSFDAQGRVTELTVGEVTTQFAYDAFSRPISLTTQHDGRTLEKQITYDTMGREHTCTFTVNGVGEERVIVQTLLYSDLDQVLSRTWQDGEQNGAETFAYDPRGRLVHYTANADAAPRDPFGNPIAEQRFTFNALDGYQSIETRFLDDTTDQASFTYADDDPTQVVAISHTHASWPQSITLTYDACGRVISDSLGRSMAWNAQDRLERIDYNGQSCLYRYDPSGKLCDRVLQDTLTRSFYSGGQQTHEQCGDDRLHLIGDGAHLFALNCVAEGIAKTTLLGCDGQGSVRIEADDTIRQLRYTTHGAEQKGDEKMPFGYTGLRREPLTGWYIPNGYRPYDPLLMCFISPDSESPFGRGGINPYAYCAGDPVNRIDPDGHSWVTWAVAGLGLAIGTVVTVASFGSLGVVLAAGLSGLTASGMLAISSSALSAISIGTGIAALGLEIDGKHQTAASVLGWISLGTGLASAAAAIAPKLTTAVVNLRNSAGRAASKLEPFKPYHIGPGGKTRPASVLFGANAGAEDVAFVPDLFAEGHAALVTHGHPLGMLMNAQGVADDAVRIAQDIIAPRLAQMGYPEGKKFILVACWGGKSGAAQSIANELGRPVEAFGEKVFIKGLASLQMPRASPNALAGNNVPIYKASLWTRMFCKPRFTETSKYRIAKPKLYMPQ